MKITTRKHVIFPIILAAFAMFPKAVAVESGGAKLIGFVSSLSGTASIKRGESQLALEGMDAVREGDIVKVDANSTISVNLCGAAKKIDVPSRAVFVAKAGGLEFRAGKSSGEAPIEKSFCEIMMQSSAKFQGDVALKDDVAEAVGAMGMLEIFGSTGAGSSGGLSDILGSTDGSSGAGMGGVGISGGGEVYDDAMYDVGPDGGGYEDDYAEEQAAAEAEMKAQKKAADESMAMAKMDSAYGDGPVIHEEKIYKPEVIYPGDPGWEDEEEPKKFIQLDGLYVMGKEGPKEIHAFNPPTIAWGGIYGAQNFKVAIFDSESKAVYEGETTEPRLEYPADAAPLAPGGKYRCKVTYIDEAGLEQDWDEFDLVLATEEEQAAFEQEEKGYLDIAAQAPESPAVHILLGKFYESKGLTVRAVKEYGRSLELKPGNIVIEKRLQDLQDQMEWGPN